MIVAVDMESLKQSVGFLIAALTFVLLASIGACGPACQTQTQNGIKSTVKMLNSL